MVQAKPIVYERFIQLMHHLLPKYEPAMYKGNGGKVATIGGSADYTGAPYYAAMTALRTGAELSHVFCVPEAVLPIKSYSPDIIVHPLAVHESKDLEQNDFDTALNIANSVIIGPGLGRLSTQPVERLLTSLENEQRKSKSWRTKMDDKSVVMDADSLWCLQSDPQKLIKKLKEIARSDYSRQIILTPNLVEFQRLHQVLKREQFYAEECGPLPLPGVDKELAFLNERDGESFGKVEIDNPIVLPIAKMAETLGVLILRKGMTDIITDGQSAYFVSEEGSKKRCGGIGDLLAGTLGTFSQFKRKQVSDSQSQALLGEDRKFLAPIMTSLCVRKASKLAYDRKKYCLIANDIIEDLQSVIIDVTDHFPQE